MAEFEAASEAIKTLSGNLSREQLLSLYALFKQSTTGDAPAKSSASMFDVKAQKKHSVWASHRGMTKDEAKAKYVEMAEMLLPKGSLLRESSPAPCSPVAVQPPQPPQAETPQPQASTHAVEAQSDMVRPRPSFEVIQGLKNRYGDVKVDCRARGSVL